MSTDSPKFVDFVKVRRTWAPAALNELCPEMYSANGGVGMYVFHVSPLIVCVPRPGPPHALTLLPLNRNRIDVIGRTESNFRLMSQHSTLVSSSALPRMKNSLTSS